mmetsp:Transcript_106136/g.305161  ORF Transcript_106136/g.305161 Transcript_106136/m.305161 type:complete len:288 (+) Transcript_106136:244-1107(+)
MFFLALLAAIYDVLAPALHHVKIPLGTLCACVRFGGELRTSQKGCVFFAHIVLQFRLRRWKQLFEILHLVGGWLRPLRAGAELHHHCCHIVATRLVQRSFHNLRGQLSEISLCILHKPVAHEPADLVAGHHIPDAVATKDAQCPCLKSRDFVDVGHARHLLFHDGLVCVALVLKIAKAAAHSKIAVQAGWVVRGNIPAGTLNPALFGWVAWLVVDGLLDQRPLAGTRQEFGFHVLAGLQKLRQVLRYPGGHGLRGVLRLGDRAHHDRPRIAAINELQAVGAVSLQNG